MKNRIGTNMRGKKNISPDFQSTLHINNIPLLYFLHIITISMRSSFNSKKKTRKLYYNPYNKRFISIRSRFYRRPVNSQTPKNSNIVLSIYIIKTERTGRYIVGTANETRFRRRASPYSRHNNYNIQQCYYNIPSR